VELTAQAALVADDIAKPERSIPTILPINDRRPPRKRTIAHRIAALDADLARQARMENTAAYATNPANDIFSRIKRLELYAQNHGAGPYATRARNLRAQLDPELQDAIRAQREEAARREALARQQAAQANRAKEARRIQALQAQVAQQLDPVASRLSTTGTVRSPIGSPDSPGACLIPIWTSGNASPIKQPGPTLRDCAPAVIQTGVFPPPANWPPSIKTNPFSRGPAPCGTGLPNRLPGGITGWWMW
jgi:hypothetical protein